MPYEKAPSSGAFLPLSLMHILSGAPMHDLSGVDTSSRPTTHDQLRTVAGIGDKKLERYGDVLLSLVRSAAS